MSSPEEQILQAIAIANDHKLQGQEIHSQAINFLNTVRSDSNQSWRPALSLFVATNDDGTRRFGEDVRLFALNILADFLDIRNSKGKLSDDDFGTLQEQFMTYLRSEYLYGQAEGVHFFIRNKFSYALTLLFLASYETQWPTFFDDIFLLLKPPPESGAQSLNPHVSNFFFKLVLEMSSEVADQILKNARQFSAERMARDGRIRDLVREKDAAKINTAVLAIVIESKQVLDQARAENAKEKVSTLEEVVDNGVRAFASYVPWIDINLTVTPDTITLLFSLLSDPALSIRLATCSSLRGIVSKGLKVASDKLKVIQVLSLTPVLQQLEAQTVATRSTLPEYSHDVETFREALARLTNVLGLELVSLCNDSMLPPDEVQTSGELLIELVPIALRFLADTYDDTSFSIFPLLTEILNSYKKMKQASPHTYMTAEKREFLVDTLTILVEKLKWDKDANPEDFDDEDMMFFENMRKDIRKTIDSIYTFDSELVTGTISEKALNTLSDYEAGSQLSWESAELAVYLVFMYGEIGGKEKGRGRTAFCVAPPNIPKEARKTVDYSNYPLTPQGEMMQALIRSRISAYPHPSVAMQFFETAARYADFFKVRKEHVLPALEAFLDSRGIHHPLAAVRKRVFYLFHRFVQILRIDIDPAHVSVILQAIQDLLTVDVEIPDDFEPPPGSDILSELLKEGAMFDTQLYMFEAAGSLVSILWAVPEIQAATLQAVINPILTRLSNCLQIPLAGSDADHLNILTVHHCIRALGSIPKGFPEYPSPVPPDYIPPPIAEFRQIAEAILISLNIMGQFRVIREAARFSFGRLIFAAGPSITEFIPRLMASLLSHFEPTEFVDFIGFLSHMTHKLHEQLRGVLDEILMPLTTHISTVISQFVTGTDDSVARMDTKKAYLTFLNTIMSSHLGSIFVSQQNMPNLQPFLETVLQMAADSSDLLNQKLALSFLAKFLTSFGHATAPETTGTSAATNGVVVVVPGIEQFIYQRILVIIFGIPLHPDFNLKDGQSIAALNEIATLFQTIIKVRGDEAVSYISTVFLPSQNLTPEKSLELTNNMRTMDKRGFQKYYSDLIKASRS